MLRQVTAALIKKDDKYLICQRSADDECGLLWEFPGGKLEEGETLEECIIREIKEELDLDIRVLDVFTTNVYHFNNKEILFTIFNAEIIGGTMKLNEHNDARWVTLEEMPSYEFMPADIVFVERLLNGKKYSL